MLKRLGFKTIRERAFNVYHPLLGLRLLAPDDTRSDAVLSLPDEMLLSLASRGWTTQERWSLRGPLGGIAHPVYDCRLARDGMLTVTKIIRLAQLN